MNRSQTYFVASAGLVLVGLVLPVGMPGSVVPQTAKAAQLHGADNPAQRPFQDGVAVNISEGHATTLRTRLTSVPAGKRLVIEFLTLRASLPPGQEAGLMIEVTASQKRVAHYIPLRGQLIPHPPAYDEFWNNQLVRLYADPNSAVDVFVVRNGTAGQGVAIVTISGYVIQ